MNMNDFSKNLLASIKAKRMVNAEASPSMLIPVLYQYDTVGISANAISSYLHLLGGGAVQADFPLEFFFTRLETALLIYTERGGGCLTIGSHSTALNDACVLFQGHTSFSLKSTIHPWNFYIFFFAGNDIQLFTPFLPLAAGYRLETKGRPSMRQNILRLLSIQPQVDTPGLLSMHQSLTNLLSLCALAALPSGTHSMSAGFPHYLTQLKAAFDLHCESPFSLEVYEQLYQISRYRLCREFSLAFGLSPLQYITAKRLEKAKEMLLTTDLSVQEISSAIGYDNVNHFIQLFKKKTGITPGRFRKSETN